MHLLFIVATIFAVSQAAHINQQSELWDSFKRTHNKQYSNADEEHYR